MKINSLTQNQVTDSLIASGVGVWVWDFGGEELIWDKVSAKLLGLPTHTLSGSVDIFLDKVVPEEKENIIRFFSHIKESDQPLDFTCQILWSDESDHHIQFKGQTFFDSNNTAVKMSGTLYDITALKQSQIQLEVSESIAKIISENEEIKDTLTKLLYVLNRYFGWELLNLWLLDTKFNELKLVDIVNMPDQFFSAFREATLDIKNPYLIMAGKTWTSFQPISMRDITQDPKFVRRDAAITDKLKGALDFPIFAGSKFIGVIELFKTKPFVEEGSKASYNLMLSIGLMIGQYIERKKSEAAKGELASIFTYANEGIYTCTLDGIVTHWNRAAQKIFGWTEDEMIGQPIKIIWPPDRYDEFELIHKRLLDEKIVEHLETDSVRKDGYIIQVEKSISLIKDEKGKTVGTSTMVQDVSSQIQMLSNLQSSEEKFRALVETTNDCIWEVSHERIITYANPAVEYVIGYTPEEVLSQDISLFILFEDRETFLNNFRLAVQNLQGWSNQIFRWRTKDGKIRWLGSIAKPMINEENQISGFRIIDRDITNEIIAERAKNEFISMVNHELRTPLTSIHGALGLLMVEKELTEKEKELIRIAYRNTERLNTIISDLLDIEKFQLAKFDLLIKPVSLVEIIDESIETAMPVAQSKDISIKKQGTFEDIIIQADASRLIQVMMNLLSNAIKFSPPNTAVLVSMEIMDSTVRVSVIDHGFGISEEFKSRIFEKFAQADTTDRRTTGTGLGLFICKNIIEKLGGKIGFKSKIGDGSVFYFDLPLFKELYERT